MSTDPREHWGGREPPAPRPRRDVYYLLAAQLDRNSDLEVLIKKLFVRLEIQQMLTQSAVHELAATDARPKGVSQQRFVNEWYRAHRIAEVFLEA